MKEWREYAREGERAKRDRRLPRVQPFSHKGGREREGIAKRHMLHQKQLVLFKCFINSS